MRAPVAIALAASLGPFGLGCLPHSPTSEPEVPVDLPSRYDQTAGGETVGDDDPAAATPDRWWVAFGDPELTHLVEQALAHNFQLRAAWARLEQFEAGVQSSQAGWWPQISAQLDVSRRRQVVFFGALGRQEFEANNFGISVPVSYELDVWNRVGAQVAAAGLDVLASRDDVEALAITVAANVAETWLDVIQQRASRRLLEEQLEANRTFLELTTLRFSHGLASALDIYQQRQQVEATEAQLAQIEAQETIARQQLAVLVARSPNAFAEQIGSLPEPTFLPPLPPLPRTGIPSHLLLRRPDVRAARRRAAAADWRLGAAIASQFPTFRFQASIGLASPTLEDLFSSFVYSIASSVLATVLDGGRLAAEARRQRAVVHEQLANFAQITLNAILEVEQALAQERQTVVNIQNLEQQLSSARAALGESRRRYAEGLSDFLPVLTALTTAQRIEQSLLASQRQLLSQRVQLARALGGAWSSELERPNLDVTPRRRTLESVPAGEDQGDPEDEAEAGVEEGVRR